MTRIATFRRPRALRVESIGSVVKIGTPLNVSSLELGVHTIRRRTAAHWPLEATGFGALRVWGRLHLLEFSVRPIRHAKNGQRRPVRLVHDREADW